MRSVSKLPVAALLPLVFLLHGKGFPTNNGSNPAGADVIDYGLSNTVSSDNAVGKIDYQPVETSRLSTTYFFGNNNGLVADASELQPQWLTQIHTRAQVVGENWTWTPSARWANEARAGYNRLYQPTLSADHPTPAADYGLNTGVTNSLDGGLPRINIAPFYVFPQELGGFNWPNRSQIALGLIDHPATPTGNHSIKFGGELHQDAFTGGAAGGARGRIKFGFGNEAFPGDQGIEDFFAGVPTSGSLLVGDPTRHIHNLGFAGFAQDDWRLAPTFTLNLGFRYELNTVIKEDHNLLGTSIRSSVWFRSVKVSVRPTMAIIGILHQGSDSLGTFLAKVEPFYAQVGGHV